MPLPELFRPSHVFVDVKTAATWLCTTVSRAESQSSSGAPCYLEQRKNSHWYVYHLHTNLQAPFTQVSPDGQGVTHPPDGGGFVTGIQPPDDAVGGLKLGDGFWVVGFWA